MNHSFPAAKKITATCAAIGLVLFAVLRNDTVKNSASKAAGTDGIDRITRIHDRRKQIEKAKADLVKHAKADRVKALEGFKSRWLAVGPDDARRQELADECVKALLLHPEMIELLLFLKQNGNESEIWRVFDNLGQSELATAVRSSLIATAALDTGCLDEQSELIRVLCYSIGRCCPEEEFERFFAALEQVSVWSAQQSLFGFCEKLVRTRPKDALQSVLTQISKRVDSKHTVLQATRLFHYISPMSWEMSDFVDMESMLNHAFPDKSNPVPGSDRTIDALRRNLFELWGERDIKAATAAALNYQDPVVLDLLGAIGLKAADKSSLVDWVSNLPNERYRNAAASGLLGYVHLLPPEVARELVTYLSDPALRTKKLDLISHFEKNGIGDPY